MSKVKHTPGPWEFETWQYRSPETGKMDKRVPCVCSSLREMRIAALDSDEGNSPNPYTFTLEEAEANARLIAAAPDLLEACKSALVLIQGCTVYKDMSTAKELMAPIAKAEGEEV